MNSISKYFPHPVLGLSDDITGNMILEIEVERNQIDKTIVFKILKSEINNAYFKNLIEEGEASILFKVYCSSTFKTFNFLNVSEEFKINENEICNKIEIEPFIISSFNKADYSDQSFNAEFDSQNFEVNKYDVIGILGKITIPINQRYEKLGIGNLFVCQHLIFLLCLHWLRHSELFKINNR